MILWIISAAVALGVLALAATGVLIAGTGAAKKEPDCDFLIVLGHRNRDGSMGTTMNERVARAASYLQSHPQTRAVLSGGEGEAAYMRNHLIAAGIAENRLILEENSQNTWQNMRFSLPLTEGESVAVLSSDFHLFRAKLYLKNRKIAVIPAKTEDFPRWLFNFCREIAGVWHYILLGGTYDEQYLR